MRTTKSYLKIFILLLLTTANFSCKKYLEAKPDQKLAVPTSLVELQGLLDNYSVLNQTSGGAGEACADNYYMELSNWQSLPYLDLQRMYTWEKENLFAQDGRVNEWNVNYTAVYYCNTVLGALNNIPRTSANKNNWDNIKGQALYFRGQFLLRTVLTWALAYDPLTSSQNLGIPLRLNEDFNEPTTRANLEASYQQILQDFRQSAALLPTAVSHPARPCKPAAFGLLARTQLAMSNYRMAELSADSCLMLYPSLLDYNEINVNASFPFQQFNKEVIHWSRIIAPRMLNQSNAKISPELYSSYRENDLRKIAFFRANADGSATFKGYYEGAAANFGGVATDEIMLTKAECAARNGNLTAALQALNTLMVKRIRKDQFVPLTASGNKEALTLILNERRKELLMRDLRWMDIKRLNNEGASISITRKLGEQIFTLPANDNRFALPIPEDVITLSGIPQNPR